MRIRGVLCCVVLLVAAAGCARDAESVGAPEPASPVVWTEPDAYKFTFRSSCGEQPLLGTFAATVEDGAVTGTEGVDEAGRRALMLRIANIVPTLGDMVEEARSMEAQGGIGEVVYDPADGHPVSIKVDQPNSIDEEACYEILEYTIGVQPEPSVS